MIRSHGALSPPVPSTTHRRQSMSASRILALDVAGAPHRWIDVEDAAHYYAKGMIAWAVGDTEFVLHGGIQRSTFQRSVIRASSIIAISGREFIVRNYGRVPGVQKDMLFARDRYVCAYCGGRFKGAYLEMEHVYPRSRGGAASWMNLVTACKDCNDRKKARTPEEAKMPLLYLPYVPNRHEAFILANRRILTDQMEFLLQGVPRHSRLHEGS
jgi:hypothetical protein